MRVTRAQHCEVPLVSAASVTTAGLKLNEVGCITTLFFILILFAFDLELVVCDAGGIIRWEDRRQFVHEIIDEGLLVIVLLGAILDESLVHDGLDLLSLIHHVLILL